MKNQPIQIKPSTILMAVVTTACLLAAQSAIGASDTWVGNTTASWNLAGNWNPASVPATGDDLTFWVAGSQGAGLNNDITAGTIFDSITFSSGASAYTLAGNSVTLTNGYNTTGGVSVTGGGIANNAGSSVNEIISLPLTLSAGNHAVSTGSGSGTLSFSGTYARNADATVQFTKSGGNINYTSSGLANVNGIIGGYAVIGLGSNAGDWAALDGSQNVIAYASYSTKSGGTSLALSSSGGNAATNMKINSRSSTANTLNSTTAGT